MSKASTVRTCVAWVKFGIVMNSPMDITVKVDQLPTKSYSWQYYAAASFGITRLEEIKVVQIDVQEP